MKSIIYKTIAELCRVAATALLALAGLSASGCVCVPFLNF